MSPTLSAGTLTLRALRETDAADLHRLINDWSVVRMLSRPPFPYPRDLADAWIADTRRQAGEGSAFHFAVIRDDALIGCVGVSLDRSRREANLGYWLGRDHWGQGLATLAAGRAARWAMASLPIERLTAFVAFDNPASAAVLRRIGFSDSGQGRQPFLSRGGDHPVTLFTATRDAITPEPAPAEPSATPRRTLLVVAAALIDSAQRVLLARRPEGKPLAGLWEFPGGKVEAQESPEQALIREFREELGVDLAANCVAPFTFVSQDCGRFHLMMPLYLCRRWHGVPQPREGQELAWVDAARLEDYPMPEPDKPLIPLLRELL